DDVDCLMQPLPAFASHSSYHAVSRSCGERRQTEQRNKTKRKTSSVHYFARDFAPIEHQVDRKRSKMRAGISEGAYPDHSANGQKTINSQDSAERPHRECGEKKYQRPIAGAMDQICDRSWIKNNLFEIEKDLPKRREQTDECNNTKD